MLKLLIILSFLFGVASNLYVRTGMGYVGMFDLVAFMLGPVLYIMHFRWFTKQEQMYLLSALFWVLGSLLINNSMFGFGDITLKAIGVTASMWCMSVVWLVILRRVPHAFIYIILGMYIGNVLGLYIFQNGALLSFAEQAGYSSGYMGEFLQEKQVLPSWLWLACVGGGTILYHLLPRATAMLVGTGFLATAFIVLFNGGSRITFGINLLVALLAYGIVFARVLVRSVLNNLVVFSIVGLIVVRVMFLGYSHLAETGQLGEAEYAKYEDQFGDHTGVADNLSERGGYEQTWDDFKNKPLGNGGVGAIRHSAISDAIYKEGLFAVPFWLFFMWILVRFIRKHLYMFDKWVPFLGLVFITVIWNALASPFAGRSMYCFAGCIAILAESQEFLAKWVWYRDGKHARKATLFNRYR